MCVVLFCFSIRAVLRIGSPTETVKLDIVIPSILSSFGSTLSPSLSIYTYTWLTKSTAQHEDKTSDSNHNAAGSKARAIKVSSTYIHKDTAQRNSQGGSGRWGGGNVCVCVWGGGGSERGKPRLTEEREMGGGRTGGGVGAPFGNNSRSSAAAVLYPLQS